jgi:hypothetical protein
LRVEEAGGGEVAVVKEQDEGARSGRSIRSGVGCGMQNGEAGDGTFFAVVEDVEIGLSEAVEDAVMCVVHNDRDEEGVDLDAEWRRGGLRGRLCGEGGRCGEEKREKYEHA